ncbi:MAG: FAD-binding protein [Candidatus Dadabacteria bacterium]|nr:MAG: FAD-binding protein [Candidatus Dadabacteria bacterium]
MFNRAMMRRYAPDYVPCSMRLGQPGDIGDGIRLGQSVGGQVGNMDRCCTFIFINPPSAWVRGVIVGRNGQRICNEEYYGSTIGVHMVEKAGGKAVLVLDEDAMSEARKQMRTEYMGGFQKYAGYLNNHINRKKAWTIEELEEKCGFAPGQLVSVIDTYNAGVHAGKDEWGKNEKYLYPVEKAPFYAINLDVDERTFMTPHFTIGGLRVEDLTQRVLREDGTPIEGLYAAGRTAVGVSSHSYVSGLSVADCIFSGRNAGRSISGTGARQKAAGAAA